MQILIRVIFLVVFCLTFIRSEAGDVPNIVLISIDTLRADRLSCYGYPRKTSPFIDDFARGAVLFKNAYSVVPLTLPAHASMLSGVYPQQHGIRDNAHFPLKHLPFLPQILQKRGYTTAAFISGAPLSASFGLNRGFDLYDDDFEGPERSAKDTTDRVLHWLKSAAAPYFLWVHYFDPHAEYEPPAQFAKRFKDPYDGEIAFVDSQLARLLPSTGKNTIVVLTADHGESLGEHGESTHATFLYNSTIHVPLLIRAPGLKPLKRSDPVSIIDIAPTLLDLAGEKISRVDGVSVLHKTPNRTLLAESLYAQRNYGYAPLFASIRDHKKFIDAPQAEFYDLSSDPKEVKNLIRETRVEDWARPVREYSRRSQTGGVQTTPYENEEAEMLRSLGYVSGVVKQTGADPKKKIEIMERFRLGMVMLKKEQYSQAETRFREIVQTENQNGLAFRFLADALAAQRKYAEAAKAYTGSLERLPDPEVAVQLAKTYNRLQKQEEAEKVLQDTIKRFPSFEEACFELASFYTSQKRWGDALAVLNREKPEFHNQKGMVYLAQGNVRQAVLEFQSAIAGGEKATYWNNLGIAYQRMNQAAAAEDAYGKALEINPKYGEAEANLAFFLISLERWEEAERHLESLTARKPRLWRARMAFAYVHEMQGKEAEAAELYRKLLSDAPQSWPERAQAESRLQKLQMQPHINTDKHR